MVLADPEINRLLLFITAGRELLAAIFFVG
jgi:hypothetical protein